MEEGVTPAYLLWFIVVHTWSTNGTRHPLTNFLGEALACQTGGRRLAIPHHTQSMQPDGTQLATTCLYEVDRVTRRDGPVADHQGAYRQPDARQTQQYDEQQERHPGKWTFQHDITGVLVFKEKN